MLPSFTVTCFYTQIQVCQVFYSIAITCFYFILLLFLTLHCTVSFLDQVFVQALSGRAISFLELDCERFFFGLGCMMCFLGQGYERFFFVLSFIQVLQGYAISFLGLDECLFFFVLSFELFLLELPFVLSFIQVLSGYAISFSGLGEGLFFFALSFIQVLLSFVPPFIQGLVYMLLAFVIIVAKFFVCCCRVFYHISIEALVLLTYFPYPFCIYQVNFKISALYIYCLYCPCLFLMFPCVAKLCRIIRILFAFYIL